MAQFCKVRAQPMGGAVQDYYLAVGNIVWLVDRGNETGVLMPVGAMLTVFEPIDQLVARLEKP